MKRKRCTACQGIGTYVAPFSGSTLACEACKTDKDSSMSGNRDLDMGFLCGLAVATIHAYDAGVQVHMCREMIGTFKFEDFKIVSLSKEDFRTLKEILK